MCEKKYAEYRDNFSSERWVELPFDQPANSFIKNMSQTGTLEKKLSPQQAEMVLKSITSDGKEQIHKHIYRNRIRPSEELTTKPFSFFWEAKDLLEAIFIAHCKNPKAGSEQLCKETFDELARIMSKKTMCDTFEFPTTILLADPDVQHAMVKQFSADIRKRLDAIGELAKSQSVGDPGRSTISILQKLDDVLLGLIDNGGIGTDSCQEAPLSNELIYTQKIEKLYFRLMYIREAVHRDRLFRLPSSPENDAIIHKIANMLNEYKRGISDEYIEEFKQVYLQFAGAYKSLDKITMKAQVFLENYLKLDEYVRKPSTLDEFREQAKEELYRFANELFSSVEKSDLGYTDSFADVFTHAQDAFAYSKLNSVHSEIWRVLHTPLWLLSMVKVIDVLTLLEKPSYGNPVAGIMRAFLIEIMGLLMSKRVHELTARVKQERINLHEQFPAINLLRDFQQTETIARFVSSYNLTYPHVYDVSPIDVQYVLTLINEGVGLKSTPNYNSLMVLKTFATLLKMECQMVTIFLIDQAVEKITNEHMLLEKYY